MTDQKYEDQVRFNGNGIIMSQERVRTGSGTDQGWVRNGSGTDFVIVDWQNVNTLPQSYTKEKPFLSQKLTSIP